MGAGKVEHPQHRIRQALIPPPLGKQRRKLAEGRGIGGVGGLERRAHRLLPHLGKLLRIPHPKGGGQTELLPVLPQQLETERIDGADQRPVEKLPLTPGRRIGGVGGNPLGKLFDHPLLHLPRGVAGKGDNQQPVGRDRVGGIEHPAHRTLGEHRRFAASGGGGDEDGVPPRIQSALLVPGPFGLSAHCSASSCNSFKTASRSRAASSRTGSPSSKPQIPR